jgi:gamma-glutamylcyclotransferase
MTWYFAYGSNLWIDQMVARLGPLPLGAEQPRIARLPGYRLAFNMRGENGEVYANIVRPGEYVLGVIYSCDADALEKLDQFERGYHRQRIVVVGETGETVEAVAYVAEPENVIDGGKPSTEYVQRILRGVRQHGLPEAYLREIESFAG